MIKTGKQSQQKNLTHILSCTISPLCLLLASTISVAVAAAVAAAAAAGAKEMLHELIEGHLRSVQSVIVDIMRREIRAEHRLKIILRHALHNGVDSEQLQQHGRQRGLAKKMKTIELSIKFDTKGTL